MRLDGFPLVRLLESRLAASTGARSTAARSTGSKLASWIGSTVASRAPIGIDLADNGLSLAATRVGVGTTRPLLSRFEEPRIGAVARALWWEVDSEIERACEEVREPFKLRRDVARLELDGRELEGMERGAQPVGVAGFDSASPVMPSINSVLPSRSRSP